MVPCGGGYQNLARWAYKAQDGGVHIDPTHTHVGDVNKGEARDPYSYRNGGDWCWFGGRTIQQLVSLGYIAEAYRDLQPMVERVVAQAAFTSGGHATISRAGQATSADRLASWDRLSKCFGPGRIRALVDERG